MNHWDILGISQTDNEDDIKRAYRAKLKHHHPETDPEGFKRLKQAYDQALAHLRQPVTTVLFDEPAPTVVRSSLIQTFETVFTDPAQRFSKTCWQTWQQTFMQGSLVEQRETSHHVLDTLLANRWLPGDVVGWLWEMFQWQYLLRGKRNDQNLGEFLQHWATETCPVPLDVLSELSLAQQRAVLLQVQPLTQSRIAHHPDVMVETLCTAGPHLHLHHPAYWLTLLQAFCTTGYWPELTTLHAIEHLIALPHSALHADDWRVIARACDAMRLPDQYLITIEKAIEGQHYALAAENLYQWLSCNDSDQDTTMVAAFLYQQWDPQPAMWWRFQPQWQVEASRSPHHFSFLQRAFNGDRCNLILSPLQHADVHDFADTTYAGIWAGLFGNTLDMALWQKKAAEQQHTTKNEILLLQLLGRWLAQQKAAQPYTGSLEAKLNKYGAQDWLDVESLTDDEITSLTQDQWLELYLKFPLLPDNWFQALLVKGVLSNALFSSQQLPRSYPKRLGHYRSVNPEFEIASPLGGQRFETDFAWLTIYYYQLVGYGIGHSVPQLALPPATLAPCPLVATLPFILKPENEHVEHYPSLLAYPEQFVCHNLLHDLGISLYHNTDTETLLTQAQEDPLYLVALMIDSNNSNDLDSTIICWNILATDSTLSPVFKSTITWIGREIVQKRKDNGINYDNVAYGSREYLHLMITDDLDWVLTGKQYLEKPIPQGSEDYYYPMGYLLSMLHHTPNESDFDASTLTPLTDIQSQLNERERSMVHLALHAIDKKMRHHAKNEKSVGNAENAKPYSRAALRSASLLLFIMLWFFPHIEQLSAVNWHWVFSAGQLLLLHRIQRAMKSGKRWLYLIPIAIDLGMWWDNGLLSTVSIGLANIIAAFRLPPTNTQPDDKDETQKPR